MLEDVAVEDRGGALHLAPLLPSDLMADLVALPPIVATRESAIAIHIACAQAFLPLARQLYARLTLTWPQALEDAARAHLLRSLNLDF